MSEFSTQISAVEPGRVLIRGYSHAEIIGRLPYASATYLTGTTRPKRVKS